KKLKKEEGLNIFHLSLKDYFKLSASERHEIISRLNPNQSEVKRITASFLYLERAIFKKLMTTITNKVIKNLQKSAEKDRISASLVQSLTPSHFLIKPPGSFMQDGDYGLPDSKAASVFMETYLENNYSSKEK